jgi:hypothetical protein
MNVEIFLIVARFFKYKYYYLNIWMIYTEAGERSSRAQHLPHLPPGVPLHPPAV